MSAANRYAFQPIGDGAPIAPRGAAHARPMVSEADLAAARQEGFAAGQREAQAQTERASAEALRAIARMMQMMLGGLGAEAQALRADAVDLALAAARRLAGAALDNYAPDAVAGFVADALVHLRETPRLVIKVAPDLADPMAERLEQVAREAGFAGQVVVRADPARGPADCTIEWGDGTIDHDQARSLAAVEEAAERWLEAASHEGLQLDLFSD